MGRRAVRVLLDADQVADLVDQAAYGRRVLELAHVIELAQAQRAHALAVALLAAVDALVQADADGLARVRVGVSHFPSPRRPSCPAWKRSAPGKPSPAGR